MVATARSNSRQLISTGWLGSQAVAEERGAGGTRRVVGEQAAGRAFKEISGPYHLADRWHPLSHRSASCTVAHL